MNKLVLYIALVMLAVVLTNCKKELSPIDPIVNPSDTVVSMDDLVIPKDFSFETSKSVNVIFSDFKASKSNEIKYNVYLYTDETTTQEVTYEDEGGEMVTETVEVSDVMNNLVTTIISSDPNLELNITIPDYYQYLYIIRNDMGVYTSQIIPIENNKAVFGGMKSVNDDPVDVIYGVNAQGDVFTINPVTGDFVIIDHYPSGQNGSVTCALDPVNRIMYTIARNTRDLLAYDIDTHEWEVRGNTNLSGPRLEYRKEDGLLYFSKSNLVKTLDPSDGSLVSTYTVNGLDDAGWGDVAFDANGVFFMATKSGLYRCDPAANNTFNAVRISADNLPFSPTSMTFDSNGELWIGSNIGGAGQVVVMDQVTGGWEYRFQGFAATINDLTFLPLDDNQIPDTDTDGDGIIDFYDEYPEDGDRAYDVYTPSIYGWGSYAFEDLWPNEGDYDFNDLVINYRYINVANSNDEIVETKMLFNIKNVGGSFHNGFGIEIDMDESLIQLVSGFNITDGVVTLNSKGLESNQAKPVIIPFDDAWDNVNGGEMEVLINYNAPITADQLGAFNPFIFINADRGREVHMSDMSPTSLANTDYFGTADDNSDPASGRYYKNANNLPWGIDIIHDFVYLQEKSPIILGYNKFADWAQSGGVDFPDWYKDRDGYRNNAYLVN